MTFYKKFKTFYNGLKITTNTTTISIIVGISLIILKNFELLVLVSNANLIKIFAENKMVIS